MKRPEPALREPEIALPSETVHRADRSKETPETPGPAPEPADLSQGIRARPEMDWLQDPEIGPEVSLPTAPETPPPPPDAAPAPSERPQLQGRAALVVGIAALALLAGYLALRAKPEPRSAALDAERAALQAPAVPEVVEIGTAEPLASAATAGTIPVATTPPAPEIPATPAVAPEPAVVPQEPPKAAELAAPELPAAAAAPPGEPPEAPPADPADAERLVHIAKTLEAHQALIERLERSEVLLRGRIEGLELRATQAASEPPAAPKAKPSLQKRAPPTTSSPPVKTLQRQAGKDGPPLPFSVESVDTWNGEPTVVVRDGGRLIDLKPGETHAGWRIESADGQTVTVRSSNGIARTVEAGEGGGPWSR